MVVHISELFKLNTLSSGRRIFAFREVRAEARRYGYKELVAHIDKSLEHEHKVLAMDRDWMARDIQSWSAGFKELDNLVDQTVTAIRDGAQAQAKGAPLDDEIHDLVDRFVTDIFPMGVAAITQLPYVEELAEIENLVRRLQGDMASMVAELGLGRQVERLAELLVSYRSELENKPERLRFETVRQVRATGQARLIAAVALIAGKYHDDENPEHVRIRSALLAPILAQSEAVRAYLRTRRAVRDIDPDTGEVTGEVTGDIDTEQPAAAGAEPTPA